MRYADGRLFIAISAFTMAADAVENSLLEHGAISASMESPEFDFLTSPAAIM